MQKQEKLQNLDEDQLEMATGGMDPAAAAALEHHISFPIGYRMPITSIRESPEREAADAKQWVSENPNKRRRIS